MAEYISREAMVKNLTADLEHHSGEGDPRTHLVIQRFIKYVEDFPSSDVPPMKHGRWLHEKKDNGYIGFIVCSQCGHEAYWDTDYGQQLFNYCPYCGAKMINGGDTECQDTE